LAAVRALDESSGRQLWQADLTEPSGVALAGGRVWVLGASGALDGRNPRTGQVMNRLNLGPGVADAPSAGRPGPALWGVADRLVTVQAPGIAVGFDTTGKRLWSAAIPTSGAALSGPFGEGRGYSALAVGSTLVVGAPGRVPAGCSSPD
jgi:outer membrane protein assembly factor BamB